MRFASQSCAKDVFRKAIGATPREYRGICAGTARATHVTEPQGWERDRAPRGGREHCGYKYRKHHEYGSENGDHRDGTARSRRERSRHRLGRRSEPKRGSGFEGWSGARSGGAGRDTGTAVAGTSASTRRSGRKAQVMPQRALALVRPLTVHRPRRAPPCSASGSTS